MGLNFLGREKKGRAVRIGVLHVLGAVLGGALVGGLFGWLGTLLSLLAWRPWIIAVVAVLALLHSLSRRPSKLGLQCQVPRRWRLPLPLAYYYFFCGALLGCGIATVIPYSSLLILLGTQLTSGVILGCASGAIFGGTREAMALIPLLCKYNEEVSPSKIMQLLPALATKVQKFNTIWILGGSSLLLLAGWH